MSEPLKILLLEDSETDAEFVQRAVQKDYVNSIFHVAMTEEDFIDSLDRFHPDVILADNSMPHFNATEALKIIRQRKMHLPFIMVTGTMSEEFAANIIKSGADDYILKDSLIRLPSAIDSALRQCKTDRERAHAIEMLTQSEEKYRALVERVSDAFIALDNDWNIIYSNKVAADIMGHSTSYLLGKNLRSLFPDSTDSPFFKVYGEAMVTQRQFHLQDYSEALKKWFEVRVYPSESGISVYFRDITEQRLAEEEIRKTEEKHLMFIQRITDAFIALDRNWIVTHMNEQAGKLMQRTPDSLLGKNIWTEFPGSELTATYAACHRAIQDQRFVSNVDHNIVLDLWHENFIYPADDGLSIFVRNITEKKRLEIQLQDQQKKEQLNLIASALEAQEKERNTIGQELHDNVNQILVGTNLMLSMAKDNPQKSNELIRASIKNIRSAIDENRKIAHELVTPDLVSESLLKQIYRILKSMLGSAGIKTTIDHETFSEYLLNNEQKLTLYRIAQEQCTNIIKYADASHVSFYFSTANNSLKMEIADNGKGMSANTKSKGIGLKNIAGRLSVFEGSVSIESAPGEGFKLKIVMPLILKGSPDQDKHFLEEKK